MYTMPQNWRSPASNPKLFLCEHRANYTYFKASLNEAFLLKYNSLIFIFTASKWRQFCVQYLNLWNAVHFLNTYLHLSLRFIFLTSYKLNFTCFVFYVRDRFGKIQYFNYLNAQITKRVAYVNKHTIEKILKIIEINNYRNFLI